MDEASKSTSKQTIDQISQSILVIFMVLRSVTKNSGGLKGSLCFKEPVVRNSYNLKICGLICSYSTA